MWKPWPPAALMLGDYDIAITLAGAAEDMIDRPGSLFSFATAEGRMKQFGIERKELIEHMNRERDWELESQALLKA